MTFLKQSWITATLVGYILLSVGSFLVMEQVHQHGMSPMSHCPFMVGEQSLCTMDAIEHIAAWNTLTTTTFTELFVLTLLVFAFFFYYFHPPNLALKKSCQKLLRENCITKLFSQGILHPKAP